MQRLDVPPRSHECWNHPEWRTATLKRAVDTHQLQTQELADLCDVALRTARQWLNNHRDVIPAVQLRALLFDLNARVA